jgi:hypothetical protein
VYQGIIDITMWLVKACKKFYLERRPPSGRTTGFGTCAARHARKYCGGSGMSTVSYMGLFKHNIWLDRYISPVEQVFQHAMLFRNHPPGTGDAIYLHDAHEQ